jgi:hypothetical protein
VEPRSKSLESIILPRIQWVEGDKFTRSVDQAMLEFLRAIKRIAPEVLSSLASDVLPLYKSVYLSGTAFDREYLYNSFTREITYGVGPAGRMPIASMPDELLVERSDGSGFFRLRVAVYRWAKLFHLDGWVLDIAMRTLKAWYQSETTRDLDWEYGLDRPVMVNPALGFRFEYPQWQPDADTWSSYEKKLDKALSLAMSEYKRNMLATSKGIKSGRPVGKYKLEHFEWLVYFQVKEKNYKEIYEQYKTTCNIGSSRAVSKAIKESAMLLDLPLRDTGRKPGRPRKR